MRAFRQFLIVTACTGCGVTLAIGIALVASDHRSPIVAESHDGQSRSRSESIGLENQRDDSQGSRTPTSAAVGRLTSHEPSASGPPRTARAVWHEPSSPAVTLNNDATDAAGQVEMLPHPLIAQQFGGASGNSLPSLDTLMEMLRAAQDRASIAPTLPNTQAPASAETATPSPSAPTPPPPSRPPMAKIEPATGEGAGPDQLMINIQDENIRTVLEAFSAQGDLNILASPNVQGNVSAVLSNVDLETALDAILKSTGFVSRREGNFIYVGTVEDFQRTDQQLDEIATRMYRPNYVTAAELQALLEPLVTSGIGKISVTSPTENGIAPDANAAGGDTYAAGETVIVQDYRAVLEQFDQIVREVDQRPTQVAIEAMILSVRLSDAFRFGIDWDLLRDRETIEFSLGAPGGTTVSSDGLDTSTSGNSDITGGLTFAFLDSSLGSFLEALETVGDANVIATPRLMCLNKQRAEILIGAELGYVSTTVTETSTSQSVEFLEVGAQLRLRPFISSDGNIRMEVHPELSTGQVRIEGGFTLPDKELTSVTTNIMVRDGCTLIIGGLVREDLQTNTTQIPLLGNLPGVGVLFRQKEEVVDRREILVLVTPHIVYEPQACAEGEQGACEFHRRQAIYADKMSPVGKRLMGRKYFQLAQQTWSVGDRPAALRYIHWSIHFDPLNRAAIDLQSEIEAGGPPSDHGLPAPHHGPPMEAPLDGEEISPWLMDALSTESPLEPHPTHPRDPGTPGEQREIARPRNF